MKYTDIAALTDEQLTTLADGAADRILEAPYGGWDWNNVTTLEELTGVTKDRVKWINRLRDVVSLNAPLNKAGSPIVSDADLVLASVRERLITLLSLLP